MKKIISLILSITFIFLQSFELSISTRAFANDVYKGSVEVNKNANPQYKKGYFTEEYKKIEANNSIDMTVAQVLNGAIAQEGDEFFAEVTTDVLAGSGVLLPVGTIAHGKIRQIEAPKRLGRDGYIEISFDYLVTPDGREIPIEGNMSSKLSNAKATAKIVAEDAQHVLTGGIIGSCVAFNLAGYAGTIASNGYTILGGAAIGGAIALGISLMRKGDHALITPGDKIKVKIRSEETIPVISHEALKVEELQYPGLDVEILNVIREKDPFGNDNTITLDLMISNKTSINFSAFDITLRDDLNTSYPPSVFTQRINSLAFTKIPRNSTVTGTLSFNVNHPNRKHWLVFSDRYQKAPLARLSVDNAIKNISLNKKKVKTDKRRKRNFWGDEDINFTL